MVKRNYINEHGQLLPYEEGVDTVDSRAMPDLHMMVDIETYDTEITAVILSIAAVTFNPRGFLALDEWHSTVSRNQPDRTVSTPTRLWWEQQEQEAQDATFGGAQLPLGAALLDFTQWINRMSPTCTRIWAKSPDFDCSILAHACKEQNILWPFKFWEARCCRTIMELVWPSRYCTSSSRAWARIAHVAKV